ncbi:RNA-guided endonuclease IscB [Koleobacter methoxysyntrophicus]|uniref:RNA-guided endonuclease IscB n=1 Tax=Koleobacter methoxysyntrophicus TaxID=2751313 RepID=UPI001F504442|nr:RNA-guided endonuclease IscB [Koleobacter methoxysyntrophicus]
MFVLNKHGKPLMPCKPSKARKLLKQGKAKIVNYEPFTIQLLYGSSGYKQGCTAGIDAGSKNTGIAVTTDDGRVVYKAQVELRQDIKGNIETKRRLRRSRRNRKTRYREPRFLNRKRKDGWLPPSIAARIDAHYNIMKKLSKIIPITNIVVEVARFDVQALINPNIQGEEYQNGDMKGFDSVKEYIKIRDNYQCHYARLRPDIQCSDELTVDHIIPRSKGGTNNPTNLVCCCKEHNKRRGDLSYKEFTGKDLPAIRDFRVTVFMNVLKDHLVPRLQKIAPTKYTFGLYTRRKRKEWNLEKSHINDAIVIAGIKPKQEVSVSYYIRQVRKKKRSLHEEIPRKGKSRPNRDAKRNEKNTKKIVTNNNYWCLWDKVYIPAIDKTGYISGFTGKWVYVQDIEGNYLQISEKYKQVNSKELRLICRNNNYICQQFISIL